jgi:hypothetical protein
MTNNSIEEKFRLAIPFFSPSIDFRHHEAIGTIRVSASTS